MMRKLFAILLSLMLLSGCGRAEPPTKEGMQNFISDSEKVLSSLDAAFQESRELTYEEERAYVKYTADYDKDGTFQKAADDPSVILVVTNASMMELQLGKTDAQSTDDFQKSKMEFETELAAVKEKVQENQ